jgi:aldehyde dehydrogenase (NAD+)
MTNPNNEKFFIDGAWVEPAKANPFHVVNPATEEPVTQINLGGSTDVDRAVAAARVAFPGYSRTTKQERVGFLRRIIEEYTARFDEIAEAISIEMGSPNWFSKQVQAATAIDHFKQAIDVLEAYQYESLQGNTLIVRERSECAA